MKRLVLVALFGFIFGCSSNNTPAEVSQDSEEGDEYEAFDETGKADGVVIPKGPLEFTGACKAGDRLTIAAVGDVLLHGPLQTQAVASSTRFRSLWADVQDLIERADVSYANLEGPTAKGVNSSGKSVTDPGFKFDQVVYTSYPQFNYHPYLVDDLLTSGFDVVSTANNHSIDRRSLGADRTIDALLAAGLPFTGTRKKGSQEPWHTTTTANGITLAWLACTYATNGIPDPDHQVLMCFQQTEQILATVKSLAATPGIDAVIVTPHWGTEYNANPDREQVTLGHKLLDAGATAVIASHPHVTQPWEKYKTADGRETFIIYSLGNFVSGQTSLARKSTLLAYVGLTRGDDDGKVFVNGVRYLPMYMGTVDGVRGVRAIDRTGGASDSRAITVGMYGKWNLMLPDDAFTTTPQCDPAWTPPTR